LNVENILDNRAGPYKGKKKKKKKSIRGTALIRRENRDACRNMGYVTGCGACKVRMMQEEIEKNNKRTEIATRRYEKIAKYTRIDTECLYEGAGNAEKSASTFILNE